MKIIYVLGTNSVLGFKIDWSIQNNESMKLNEYLRSMSVFDLGQWSLRFKN